METRNYLFKIERFTPQTMPFGRLIEYYTQLNKLIRTEALRLIEIKQSSHGTVLSIAEGHYADVAKGLAAVADGTAPKAQRQASQTINGMLNKDGTSATLLTTEGAEIIAFPGMSVPDVVRTKAQVTLLGELRQISGSSNKAHASVRIQTAAYGAVFCQTSFATAKELSKLLFECIRASGRGVWERSASDGWSIAEFEIDGFCPVRRESVREAIRDVRDLDIEWPLNAVESMRSLREDALFPRRC